MLRLNLPLRLAQNKACHLGHRRDMEDRLAHLFWISHELESFREQVVGLGHGCVTFHRTLFTADSICCAVPP